jgi:hypothetical protein
MSAATCWRRCAPSMARSGLPEQVSVARPTDGMRMPRRFSPAAGMSWHTAWRQRTNCLHRKPFDSISYGSGIRDRGDNQRIERRQPLQGLSRCASHALGRNASRCGIRPGARCKGIFLRDVGFCRRPRVSGWAASHQRWNRARDLRRPCSRPMQRPTSCSGTGRSIPSMVHRPGHAPSPCREHGSSMSAATPARKASSDPQPASSISGAGCCCRGSSRGISIRSSAQRSPAVSTCNTIRKTKRSVHWRCIARIPERPISFADSGGATARFRQPDRARRTSTGSGPTFRSCCSRSTGIPRG